MNAGIGMKNLGTNAWYATSSLMNNHDGASRKMIHVINNGKL